MRIDILTIFPKMFGAVLNESILRRAQKKGALEIRIHNLRDYTTDKHRKVDDRPFGGGPGMIMQVAPIVNALEDIGGKTGHIPVFPKKHRIILLSPQGKLYTQRMAERFARCKRLALICGHYEGVDARVRRFVTDEVSIGDYILTGGEVAAMAIVDSVARLLAGVLGHKDSARHDSFSEPLLEGPQYTRPANFQGLKVPAVLLSGDHKRISEWRRREALRWTRMRRPELFDRFSVFGARFSVNRKPKTDNR